MIIIKIHTKVDNITPFTVANNTRVTTQTSDNTTKPEKCVMEKIKICKTNRKQVSKELYMKIIGEVHSCTY